MEEGFDRKTATRLSTTYPPLQQDLRSSEAPMPYNAIMRISRVDDVKLQKHLVKDVLNGKPNREIRAKTDEAKGKKAPKPTPTPKPVAKTPKPQKPRATASTRPAPP